jgi:hypothetical protein
MRGALAEAAELHIGCDARCEVKDCCRLVDSGRESK